MGVGGGGGGGVVGTQKAFIWGGFNRLPFSFVYHF